MGEFNKPRIVTFKEMLDNAELANAVLVTEDGGSFDVHLEVMLAKSQFISGLIESQDAFGTREIKVPGISKDILRKIVNCVYTNQLDISETNVWQLTDAAEQLGVADIVRLCSSYLESDLTVENCLTRLLLAKQHQYWDLKENAKKFIVANFEKVQKREEFCHLDVDDLTSILSCDALNVASEELVYSAAMRWREADPEARTPCLPNLLLCVRIGLCDYAFFHEHILSHPLISGNEECLGLLYQGSQLFSDLQQQSTAGDQLPASFDPGHPFLRPRVPHEIVYAMGGWSAGSATNAMETYDCKTRRWFLTHADSTPRAYHGMVWHGEKVYIVGGFDGQQCFNSVRSFDPVSRAWEERGCMHFQRCYVSCATVGPHLYAMGGYDGHRRNKSCERYAPADNQWTLIADMRAVRSDASADTLDGKIYIAGGFNGTQVLETAEFYDPSTNEWTYITNMNSPRSGVKMVAFRSHIYVIGGFNGTNRLATVERYDRNTRHWTFACSMLGPRSNFATAIINDCIYAIGGFNGLSTISTAEMYSPATNSWSPLADLNLNRSALAACKVFNISTAHEYTFLGTYSS